MPAPYVVDPLEVRLFIDGQEYVEGPNWLDDVRANSVTTYRTWEFSAYLRILSTRRRRTSRYIAKGGVRK